MLPDKYELLDTIAKGGQGTVYRVKKYEDDTEYALKVINLNSFPNETKKKL